MATDARIRVLLADHDPISRHVLSDLLARSAALHLIGSVDSRHDTREWPLRDADVVIVCFGAGDDFSAVLGTLSALGKRTILLGTHWEPTRLGEALELGAHGCLVKTVSLGNLTSAVAAVYDDNRVLAPDLIAMHPIISKSIVTATDSAVHRQRSEALLNSLTAREREVIDLLGGGSTTEEIAVVLAVAPSTVKSHVSRVLTKLGVRNRLEAVLLIQRSTGETGRDDPRPPRPYVVDPPSAIRSLAR
ncbi:LuxR C-terminal-related transcriptional regulator [Nocardia sp. NPDC059195]|uniref:response regulator transcription factor n=1 Tax=Nocardia sp. NPDC059195 TaxID=3346765 RepID=UPI0036743673